MAQNIDVFSYGTVGLDLIIRVPHWPGPDISTHAHSISEHLGGKATNTAAHLAAWGVRVAVSGTPVGDDDQGRKITRLIQRNAGIITDHLERKSDLQSMFCIILVTEDGERSIIGINTERARATTLTSEMLEGAKVLTLDLYGGEERILAARIAHDQGIPVVIGDLRNTGHPVLAYTTVAIASAAELAREYPHTAARECASRILKTGPSCVIVTNGADEILVVQQDGTSVTFNPPQTDVVDATGAGDAFRAGVVYGKFLGLPDVEAARLGAAAGSLAVQREGAATEPASLDEVKAWVKRIRI